MLKYSLIILFLFHCTCLVLTADDVKQVEALSEKLTKKLKLHFSKDTHAQLIAPDAKSTPLRLMEDSFPFYQKFKHESASYQQAQTNCSLWFADMQVERSSFKVIEIHQESPEKATTRVLAGLYGHSPEGDRLERHGDWKIEWKLTAEKASIYKITALKYSAIQGSKQALLQEKTSQVFTKESLEAWIQLRTSGQQWAKYLSKEIIAHRNFYQGVAIADINNDGLEDVYFCQTEGLTNRLLLQQPDGTLKDISRESGINLIDRTQSAAFVDLDNDGNLDALLGARFGLFVYKGDGNGKFEQVLHLMQRSPNIYSIAIADYDKDGLLDVYVCSYYRNSDRERFVDMANVNSFIDAKNGGRNKLYRNVSTDGKIQLEDHTVSVGLDHENHFLSLAASWHDYDDDGDLDLYVANDFGLNQFFQNQDGKFKEIIDDTGTQDQNFSMSASWGDWNRDGRSDLYISNMFSSAGRRVTKQDAFKDRFDEDKNRKIQHLAYGNSLFTQKEDGTFENSSEDQDVWLGRWAWASTFVDIDHNGWQDLLVANGYITNTKDDDL